MQLHFAVLLQLCSVYSASFRMRNRMFLCYGRITCSTYSMVHPHMAPEGASDDVIVLRSCLYHRYNVYHTERDWKRAYFFGGGGFKEVRLNLPFWSLKDFIFMYILECPTVWNGPLASLLLRITAVQTNLVAAMPVCSCKEDQRGTHP